eukprot:g3808.t1
MAATKPTKQVTVGTRFLLGGIAGCSATCCVHPLDVTRVQMQLDAEGGGKRLYKGMVDCVTQLYRQNGLQRGLYAGLSAGILRQLSYGMPRFGIYTWLNDAVTRGLPEGQQSLSLWQSILVGGSAGASASLIGVPSEVALVRMSAESRLPESQKRGYTSALDAVVRIAREEGVGALWRGAGPTVTRAVLLNVGQLGVGSQVKKELVNAHGFTPGSIPLLCTTSVVASLVANMLSVPADTLKSRMQNMPMGADGKPLYSNMLDCAGKTVQKEGVLALWKGFTPAFIKLTPHTVISFIVLEKLTKFYTGEDAL